LWAEACSALNTNWLPKVDDVVWIEFQDGNIDYPVWVGLAVANGDVDSDFLANYGHDYRKDVDYNGNSIQWTTDGMIITDLHGNIIKTDGNGIFIEDFDLNKIETNSSGINITCKNGNTIEMGSSSVKINGSNLEVLK
jgi:hypothetical protein